MKSILSKYYPFLILLITALLIFWEIPGLLCYVPDDFLQTYVYKLLPFPYNFNKYIFYIQYRAFLAQSYKALFCLFNNSQENCFYFLFAIYLLSSGLFFLLLKRIFIVPAALIGALFYLSYSGKFEAIFFYDAQIYTIIMIIFMAIVWLLTSNVKIGWQSLGVTFLLWLSMHWYEVLIVTLPIYPMLWLGPSLLRKQNPNWQLWVYSFLPSIVIAIHVYILSLTSKPIWIRGSLPEAKHLNLFQQLGLQFKHGISHTYGFEHLSKILCIKNFFKVDIFEAPNLGLLFISLLIALTLMVLKSSSSEDSSGNQNLLSKKWSHWLAFIGLYLALVSPLVGFTTSLTYVYPRILFLPSLGLAIFLAYIVNQASKKWYKPCLIFACLICLIETLALTNIYRQYLSAYKIDTFIDKQIFAITRFKPPEHSQFFVASPSSWKKDYYRLYGMSAYESSSAAVRLWRMYKLSNVDLYTCQSGAYRNENELNDQILFWLKNVRNQNKNTMLYPYIVDTQWKLYAVKQFNILNSRGELIKIVKTNFSNYTNKNDFKFFQVIDNTI